jgi:hypothetical protein
MQPPISEVPGYKKCAFVLKSEERMGLPVGAEWMYIKVTDEGLCLATVENIPSFKFNVAADDIIEYEFQEKETVSGKHTFCVFKEVKKGVPCVLFRVVGGFSKTAGHLLLEECRKLSKKHGHEVQVGAGKIGCSRLLSLQTHCSIKEQIKELVEKFVALKEGSGYKIMTDREALAPQETPQ